MLLDKQKLSEQLQKPISELIIGFTASAFDLLHTGHLIMLQESREQCDYLIVGLLTDPTVDRPLTKEKPVQTVFERYMQASACKYIDEIIPFESEEDLENMIRIINPSIRFCGEEYRDIEHTGKGLCNTIYNRRNHSYSSTCLRSKLNTKNSESIEESE